MLFEIAVRTPLRRLFTYESDQPLERGMRVRVPFRSHELTGLVWGAVESIPKGVKPGALKKISKVLDEVPFFDEKTLLFFERSAQYYSLSLGDLLTTTLPDRVREGKDWPEYDVKHFVPSLHKLSEAQEKIAEEIEKSLGRFKQHLLMGEMGSGKTEVYLKVIEKILVEGGQALFLVPEISLTPQLEDRLATRLGGKITLYHSQMTESKRMEAFARAWRGETDIFLGARSALFLPFKDLKLIVVDEEHESSYKQAERGPYHGRDLSILRAQIFQIPIVLGSATPSLESYSRALETKSPIYHLTPFHGKTKQAFEIVDLRKTFEAEGRTFISQELHDSISLALEKKEQSLLFLNRRGSASQRICTECGSLDECKFCSVTLTIHRDLEKAICHWCGYQKKLKTECETCNGNQFFYGGIGTKEVELQIQSRFPEARVARIDRDQAQKKDRLSTILKDFQTGKIDILIGTQMIAKGIDIPKLSLVGVILADQGWGVPDFRGNERSYQLLRQLMGRAGRRGQDSKFLVQTFLPDHPLFHCLSEGDHSFESFAETELKVRQNADLPPFARLALFSFGHKSETVVMEAAEAFKKRFEIMGSSLSIKLIGPAMAPVARWKGVFRMHLLVKAPLKGHLTSFLTAVLDDLENSPLESFKGVKIKLDRDPYQFL